MVANLSNAQLWCPLFLPTLNQMYSWQQQQGQTRGVDDQMEGV